MSMRADRRKYDSETSQANKNEKSVSIGRERSLFQITIIAARVAGKMFFNLLDNVTDYGNRNITRRYRKA